MWYMLLTSGLCTKSQTEDLSGLAPSLIERYHISQFELDLPTNTLYNPKS